MAFGEQLFNARKEKGLTQKELALRINAAHNSISNWENNQNKPDPDTIELLCDALDVTPNYFFSREQQPADHTNITTLHEIANVEIGTRIKTAREDKNYTLEDIAKKLGMNKSTIQRYESGVVEKIKLPVVEAMGRFLEVNPAWLVGKSDKKQAPAQNDSSLDDEFIAFYGEVKKDLDENDIYDLKTFMRMKAEIKRKNEKKV